MSTSDPGTQFRHKYNGNTKGCLPVNHLENKGGPQGNLFYGSKVMILWGRFYSDFKSSKQSQIGGEVSPSSEPRIGWRFWALSSPVLNCCNRTLCCENKNSHSLKGRMTNALLQVRGNILEKQLEWRNEGNILYWQKHHFYILQYNISGEPSFCRAQIIREA